MSPGTPDIQYRNFVQDLTISRPTGQGDNGGTPEDISPTGGIDHKIIVGVGHDSGDLYYTTDATSWTKFASPGDAYEARVFEVSDGVYDAWTLEGSTVTGLELWYYPDITSGSTSGARCQYGGSTSTTAPFYDWTDNQNLSNAGATPASGYATFDGTNYVFDPTNTPLVSGQSFEARIQFQYASGTANQVLWCALSNLTANWSEITLNGTNGSVALRVATAGFAIQLAGSYNDGAWYEIRVSFDGVDDWTLATYDATDPDDLTLINSGTYTAAWSPPLSSPQYTLGARGSAVGLPFTGNLRNHKLYVNGTLIRDNSLNSDTALQDASMPSGGGHIARWQANGVDYRNGTLISHIYSNPATSVGTYLYRSTNKIDFPIVLTHAVVNTSVNNHGHMVKYLNNIGGGCWIANFGDNPNRDDYHSFDDGRTWTVHETNEENKCQIMGMWDMDDGVSVACAHDDSTTCSVRNYNVMTEFGGAGDRPDQAMADVGYPRLDGDAGSQRFAWINKPINGLYYTSHVFTNNYDKGAISVSNDGLNFVTIAHLGANENGIDRIWPLNGYIIGGCIDYAAQAIDSRIQIRFPVPTVTTTTVMRVSCAAENLLGLADSDGSDDTSYTTHGSATESKSQSGGAVTVSASDAGSVGVYAPTFSATSGDVLTATAYASGVVRENCWMDIYDASAQISGTQSDFILSDNVHMFTTKPTATAATDSAHKAHFFQAVAAGDYDKSISIDRISVFEGLSASHPFVIGGTAQADEILRKTKTRDASEWTQSVTIYPWVDSLNVIGNSYICSIVNGTSYAQLKFDGSKLVLETSDSGVNNADVNGTEILWFMRNSQLDITITVSGSNTTFAMSIGDITETLTAPSISALLGDDVTFITGNKDGSHVMPMSLVV